MVLVRPPFTSTKLQEERDAEKRNRFTVNLNPQEAEQLDKFMKLTDIQEKSVAIKFCMEFATNVMHNSFGDEFTKYLFKKERKRMSDYKNTDKPD